MPFVLLKKSVSYYQNVSKNFFQMSLPRGLVALGLGAAFGSFLYFLKVYFEELERIKRAKSLEAKRLESDKVKSGCCGNSTECSPTNLETEIKSIDSVDS